MIIRLLRIAILLFAVVSSAAFGADTVRKLVVADAYIEVRTGPGRGFPVFHVFERGVTIELLKQKTDWFKIKGPKDVIGWASRNDVEQTLTEDGERILFAGASLGEFANRTWEAGLLTGDFEGANVISIYGGWAFTQNLSTEIMFSHMLGKFSQSFMITANILHQPFPDWRYSPFFTIGTGVIHTVPRATLVQATDRTDQVLHVGAGLKYWIAKRFLLRAEMRSHVILTSRNNNEEVDEWKIGLSVFY